MTLQIGFDPEFPLTDVKKSKFIPSWGITSGDKAKPEVIYKDDAGFWVGILVDGMGLEVNASPFKFTNPKSDLRDLAAHWAYVYDLVVAHVNSKKAIVRNSINAVYDENILSDKRAKIAGCDKDYTAYAENVAMPRDFQLNVDQAARYFGGHVHIGYDPKLAPPHVVAKFMDLFWALAVKERQGNRRQNYGLPGLFRPKEYGVEYRTPSNAWCGGGIGGVAMVGNAVRTIHDLLVNHNREMIQIYRTIPWDTVHGCISTETYNRVAQKVLNDALEATSKVNAALTTRYIEDAERNNVAVFGEQRLNRAIPRGEPIEELDINEEDEDAA